MSDLVDGEITFEKGIKVVDEDYVKGIIRYLKTGFIDKTHKNYIKCYT